MSTERVLNLGKTALPANKRPLLTRGNADHRLCAQQGLQERSEHVDIKALLINTIRFSWEVCSVFRVQDWGTQGSAAACLLLFATGHSKSSPLNCSVLSCRRKKKTLSTAELIFMVYREYTGIQGQKKGNLTCMTEDNMSYFAGIV